MKIDLPLETWTDVFAFLPRRQLVQIVPHFEPFEDPWQKSLPPTIGDRQFVSFVQFYLHKCGEITLDRLWIKESTEADWQPTLSKWFGIYALQLTDVPLPMPGNIKNFQEIALEHFAYQQNSIVDFLQEFQHNSLLTDVNVVFQQCNSIDPNAVLAFLTTILPLITSINSITLENTDLFPVLLDKYWDLAKPMLASARVLYINSKSLGDDWYNWLCTPREDGKARLLVHYDYSGAHSTFSFIEHVKKDFMDAKKAEQAVSFFVHLYVYLDYDEHVEELNLDNWQTQERLVIKEHRDKDYDVSISRFPIGANAEWIEHMAKDPIFEYRNLRIFC